MPLIISALAFIVCNVKKIKLPGKLKNVLVRRKPCMYTGKEKPD